MSYKANQYNYSTPLNSSASLNAASLSVEDRKYFTLSDNVLDGTYVPVSGDVGLWGASASDATGTLLEPFVVTVTDSSTINAFRLIGSQYNYPVAFTVQFYSDTELLYTITEATNSKVEYVHYLSKTLLVTHYVISITKISAPGSAARIYNAYNPSYVVRVDNVAIAASEASSYDSVTLVSFTDAPSVAISEAQTSVQITISSSDTLSVHGTSESNIHSTVNSSDTATPATTESSFVDAIIMTADVLTTGDEICVTCRSNSYITNIIDVTHDDITASAVEGISHVINTVRTSDTLAVSSDDVNALTNVHSRMKDPSRRIYGKVSITYTDPMLDNETVISTNMEAYNSNKDQVMDAIRSSDVKLFNLYSNKLDGSYHAMTEYSQVGWVSGIASDADGNFKEAPFLRIDFAERVLTPLVLHFDDMHGAIAEDFTVEFVHENDTTTVKSFVGNTESSVLVNPDTINAKSVTIRVTKTAKPNYPVVILEVPVTSTMLYRGYADASDLMSIDILEELTYDDEVEALGGVSANETTIVLDNSDGAFYFNNDKSAISKLLRRNRKIEPWLGVEVVPGEIEWYKQGTFWSYRWNVPVGRLTATVVGFDTIGLLGTTSFEKHYTYIDKSLGELIDIVLNDANEQLGFLKWRVDPDLYNVVIPFAWFDPTDHASALRKISKAYPMHIYCDKEGQICAAPQKLHLDYYYDTWSDNTNVFSKEYGSLYTTLPNIVNVTVHIPHLTSNKDLVSDNLVFDVSVVPTRKLNFSSPYMSNLVVTMDKDASVSYTYEVYSWGIEFTFTGTGTVRSIKCVGTALDTSNTAVLTRRDDSSIRINGAVTRDVSADFIQTSSLATIILDRIFSLSATDKYDATIMYRGDIALSINDPILLLEGIAPDNRYNIRRHQLFWNGGLTGVADLNT